MSEAIRKLLRLHDETSVLIALYDPEDHLCYANRAFREAWFLEPDETPRWADLMRRNYLAGRGTVIRAADFEEWLISTQSRRGKVGFRAFETDLVDGRWLWMTETVGADGWMLCQASDITTLRAEERAIRQDRDFALRAAQTDELTGVPNRRFVMARLEEMVVRINAGDGACGCLVLLDIDTFKDINDRHGHEAGDLVLRDFASRIQGQVRRSDCFGRVGGEEFVLVLPETRAGSAVTIIERMLGAIRASRPLRDVADFQYTFSAGVAAAAAGDCAAEVYARADRALYAAKRAGRDRVCLAETRPA